MDWRKHRPEAQNAQKKPVLQRQIAVTDCAIDRPVDALYALTDAEIALVEAAVTR